MRDGYVLAIESSSPRASVALGKEGEVVFSAELEAGRRQSEVLMGPLRQALGELKGQLELVLIGMGPGSYNGARVGIAAGQGVAVIHGCPAVGLCSLEAVVPVREGGACLALGDARRGTYFTVALSDGKLSGEPDLMDRGDFVTAVERAVVEGASLFSMEDPERLGLVEHEVVQVLPSAPELGTWRVQAASTSTMMSSSLTGSCSNP